MDKSQFDDILSATLQEGLDDWIAVSDINAIALFYGVGDTTRRSQIVSVPERVIESVVRDLVGRGLVRVGDVYSRGYFVPFDGDDEAAIEWMVGVYRAGGPGWPFAAWLELTTAGAGLAESLPRARYLECSEGDGL